MKSIPIVHVVVLFGTLTTAASAQTPLLEYRFDGAGAFEASTGSNTTALTFYNASGIAQDLHSADGLGVSGLPGDKAFDNTASTGMGNLGVGGVASVPPNSFGTLSSFTFQCWYNALTPPSGAARLFDSQNFLVLSGASSAFSLEVNRVTVGASAPEYSAANQWIFFAVSYDGTQTSQNVAFYEGTKTAPVTLVGTDQTLNGGSVLGNHVFNIGNYVRGNVRPFDGYMDDVRLFGSASDASGVLGVSQLETIRQNDVQNANVPEASPSSVLIAGATLLLAVRRRGKPFMFGIPHLDG